MRTTVGPSQLYFTTCKCCLLCSHWGPARQAGIAVVLFLSWEPEEPTRRQCMNSTNEQSFATSILLNLF